MIRRGGGGGEIKRLGAREAGGDSRYISVCLTLAGIVLGSAAPRFGSSDLDSYFHRMPNDVKRRRVGNAEAR